MFLSVVVVVIIVVVGGGGVVAVVVVVVAAAAAAAAAVLTVNSNRSSSSKSPHFLQLVKVAVTLGTVQQKCNTFWVTLNFSCTVRKNLTIVKRTYQLHGPPD